MGKKQASGHVQVYLGKKGGKEIWGYEHREAMGIKPGDKRIVHHKDGNPGNNSRGNLQVTANRSEHNRIDKRIQKGGK